MTLASPLALYVHIPWCVRKCPYCDFNSHAAPPDLRESMYVDCLLEDLDHDLARFAEDRALQTVFFGGGTPSLFSPEAIGRLLEGVRARLPVAPEAEITLEANPGTIEHGRFAGYAQVGVNRISLGVQSFNDAQLRRLGRIHNADDVRHAIDELRRAGLTNFNIDLMYALPAQTLEEALADVDAAISLAPAHLSHYHLTLEPGTVFHHRPPQNLPGPDLAWEMQAACQERLTEGGYLQYEVSAYAPSDRQCRHNRNYWQFGDYLGLGAGAHGKLTRASASGAVGEIVRTVRLKQPRQYLEAPAAASRLASTTPVPPEERPFEYMLNVLRLREGFALSHFERMTGLPVQRLMSGVRRAEARGLLEEEEPGTWRATDLGWRFLNDLQGCFLD